ncbi:MAG TPA: ABC transporter ATP-binding protein [Roseiflexaceae bacterium]|nr:ABC transporter ATP-binding protein [Roseiflexaceae bacterium]
MRATRTLGRFLAPYWRWAVLAPLLMALEVAMDLLQPRLIQRIIDQGIAQRNMDVVVSTGLLQLGVAAVGLLGGLGCGLFAVMAGQGFGADLRGALFTKVQSLSFGNLDRLETGALITRLTNDVTQVQELVMMLLRIMVRVPLLLLGSLVMAVITSPQLALIFLVLVPLIVAVLVWIINVTFPMFGEVQRRLDALNTVMQENLAGVRVVKAFARGAHERARFSHANDRLMAQNIIALRTGAATMPFMMLAMNGGVVAALWFGGVQVSAGGLQVGQLVAFINYLTQTLMSLMMISMLVMRFARAEASAARIQEVLASEPEVPASAAAVSLARPAGRVAFEGVSFGYADRGPTTEDRGPGMSAPLHAALSTRPPPAGDLVLKDISFVVEPGQTVAILGATGAGKSSLVNLIPRFYDVSAGRVTLDGVDVRELDEATLRAAVGVALQESLLFSGTIRDNIRYGRPEATEEEVVAAARLAQAHEFISRLPDGYDSLVGQRGVNLSGGQKQRIAIARALLLNPAVLVLDDATSAVDVATEARIQSALASLERRPTRIVVAQRISAVLAADSILVLDDGRVVAQGTHAELMERSPIYREIYESQMDNGAIIHD